MKKGGHNDDPSQVTQRPPSPPPSNPSRLKDDEVIGIVLAIEEEAKSPNLGSRGVRLLAHEAARIIRGLRPDLEFKK
jgi:hypothetical protein